MLSPACTWGSGRRTVVNSKSGKCMPGITKTLQKIFFPSYKYRKATNGPKLEAKKSTVTRTARKAKRYGSHVDQQVTTTVFKSNDLPETRKVKKFMQHRKWVVIQSQFPLADEELGLCTCADVLVYSPETKKYTIVELKTGYETYRFRYCKKMRGVLSALTDCPFNQHMLQLFTTWLLFKRSFPYERCDMMLIYTDTEEISHHNMLPAISKYERKITQALNIRDRTPMKQRQRRKKRKRAQDGFSFSEPKPEQNSYQR